MIVNAEENPVAKPSFILIITDQHRADYLECYGHKQLKTPNIDSLAEDGVLFERFYVSSPVCMPNRASFMTCRMPSSHGVRCNGIPLAKKHVTFVELLRAAGYDTALIGKAHFQNFAGMPPSHKRAAPRPGFMEPPADLAEAIRHDYTVNGYLTEDPASSIHDGHPVEAPYYGFDHVELVTEHGDNVGGHYRKWLLDRLPDADRYVGVENQLAHNYICPQAVRTALPEELYSTSYIAERATAYLEARRGNSKPFFLMVSFPDPHHPFNPPGKYWDMYAPEEMEAPQSYGIDEWLRPDVVEQVYRERLDNTAKLDGMGTIAVSLREAQEARALTCGMISMIDNAVGSILEHAPKDAVRIFTSDHGDHLGDHGLLFKGSEPYEQITRVPFIWSDPEGPKGVRYDGIGQTHDIGTSILERSGIEASEGMQGRKLAPVGGSDTRSAAFIQYEHQVPKSPKGRPQVHTLRTKNWRLTIYRGEAEGELYNLDEDPHELDNLWLEPQVAAEKWRLMELLLREEMAAVNTVPLPTGRA